MTEKDKFLFETVDEAEDYFWGNIARHKDDDANLDIFLQEHSDDIRESYEENHKEN